MRYFHLTVHSRKMDKSLLIHQQTVIPVTVSEYFCTKLFKMISRLGYLFIDTF